MTNGFNRVQAAVIDGTAESPRFKQRQLMHLHDALVGSRINIVDAIRKDHGYSNAEAHIQFHMTLLAVSEAYSSLNLEQLLANEYSIANSRDNFQRRKPIGCAYIIASQPYQLYSIIAPMAAAIAAGNCILLELAQTVATLGLLLRRLLISTLDVNTFAVVESKPEMDFIDRYCITLSAEPISSGNSSPFSLLTPDARVIAVVDRSADLKVAAREIVRARFSFRGNSPYAPDLVVVNEFCFEDFCNAVAEYALKHLGSNMNGIAHESYQPRTKALKNNSLEQDLAESVTTTLLSGSGGTTVVVHDRQSKLLKSKIREPVLFLHAISSMDDAIQLVNSNSMPLLATYLFSAPDAAKYLSQFLDASLSCINHIPVELLVGPPSPSGHNVSIHPRYSTEMFSRPAPECINTTELSVKLAHILDGRADGESKAAVQLETVLAPMKEPTGADIGFFDQGLITGVSLLASSIAISVVLAGRYLVPMLMTRFGWH